MLKHFCSEHTVVKLLYDIIFTLLYDIIFIFYFYIQRRQATVMRSGFCFLLLLLSLSRPFCFDVTIKEHNDGVSSCYSAHGAHTSGKLRRTAITGIHRRHQKEAVYIPPSIILQSYVKYYSTECVAQILILSILIFVILYNFFIFFSNKQKKNLLIP